MDKRALIKARLRAYESIEASLDEIAEELGMQPVSTGLRDIRAKRQHLQRLRELQYLDTLLSRIAEGVKNLEDNGETQQNITVEDLTEIQGIGKATAEKIVTLLGES